MPLDALCLSSVREELSNRIVGMKIDKVQQPERDIVILALRGKGEPCRLLISAGVGDARVHLTEYQFENPASPPMFCMLLRKHLIGARIASVIQPAAERILVLNLQAQDAMGELSEKRLILELIGRISNIILADSERIIDCLRRVGGDLTDKRSVLPGLFYRPPPEQKGKLDPTNATDQEWQDLFDSASEKEAEKWLLSSFGALSPLICRELAWRAYGETDVRIAAIKDGGTALRREFFALVGDAKSGRSEPWIITDGEGAPRDFSFTRIMQYENSLKTAKEKSFSAMLEGFYTRKAQLERVRQRASGMSKTVRTARDRIVRKLTAQQVELERTIDRDSLRECGDIITANLHLMEKGQSELTAPDFYREDGESRRIALDPQKTPQQNAARYYKEYTKAKNAERFLAEQIHLGEKELAYLESVLHEIELAEGERDLLEINRELTQTGYVKDKRKGKEKFTQSAPMRFVSSTGFQILAGRNNTQNDALTLKTASKSDIWLHVQKKHGAHVIISCVGTAPDETTLHEAAVIAAYYSAARSGGKVPVDYAFVKHVKKPPEGRPGMVIYTDYRTIVAVPDEEAVGKLREDIRNDSKT
jgi:predicted ribosome quality control (RQC) complex YloA/Tae2 family protein